MLAMIRSPSSRRAWVEIRRPMRRFNIYMVALLAEGVGRNFVAAFELVQVARRPPRGGRG